jgi:leucyl/phenylalanyl-tRNA---protein transferase
MPPSRSPISSAPTNLSAELPGLDPETLLGAYARGIFPMADGADAPDVYWVEPERRGILPLEGFRVSRSLAKGLRSERFEHYFNRDFAGTVRHCAEAVANRPSTWINAAITRAVERLHALGHAHSVECWRDGEIVGGLYGISLGGAFFGESMFSRETDASKAALAHLIARMRVGGFSLLDCQFITPHLASLGAIEISRAAYLKRLERALDYSSSSSPDLDRLARGSSPPRTTVVLGPVSGCRILHSLTQTS